MAFEQRFLQIIQRLAVHAARYIGHEDCTDIGIFLFFPELLGLDENIAAGRNKFGLVFIQAVKTIFSGQVLIILLLREFDEFIQDFCLLRR